MTDRILDLTEELDIERPLVRLPDGLEYEMHLPTEFSLKDQARMSRIGGVFQRVIDGEAEDLSEQEADQLDRSVDRMLAMMLPDAPSEVLAQLTGAQKQRVVGHFQSFSQTAANGQNGNRPDGPPPSPSSSGSTAATPAGG